MGELIHENLNSFQRLGDLAAIVVEKSDWCLLKMADLGRQKFKMDLTR